VSAPLSGIESVLSRIAAIQVEINTPPTPFGSTSAASSNPTSATTATPIATALATASTPTVTAPASSSPTSETAFQSALQQAQGGTITRDGVQYSPSSANVTGADIVSDAESYLGVPYVYAGTTREGGMDCSGLVQTTYKDLGMQLPRISWQQQNVGVEVPSLDQAQPGDVLAFGEPAYHVAIYIGKGKMIEAPQPGESVKIADVSPPPSHIRRIVPSGISDSNTPISSGTSSAGLTGVAGVSASSLTSAASSVAAPSGLAAYSSLFKTDESKYGLPAGLLGAVAQIESGGNPNAVSPAGAQGLMQLMPGTARSLGVNALNPTQAVDGAARMLSGLLQKYHGSIPLTLAAYNAGAGAVDHYGGIPPYTETQNYVVKVQAAMQAGSA
jgi:cell wall-associated NlpC family hydrolase